MNFNECASDRKQLSHVLQTRENTGIITFRNFIYMCIIKYKGNKKKSYASGGINIVPLEALKDKKDKF